MAYEDAFVSALMDPAAPGPDGLAIQAAFAVYRNTVMKGCVDALQGNYPAVTRLLGEQGFRAIASAFVRIHPPGTPLMVSYGEGFDAFLSAHEVAVELPYLPAVAKLDRFWTQCHLARSGPVLPVDALTGMDPDAIAACVLHVHPAARWEYFEDCPAYSIWSRNRVEDANQDDLDWQAEGALLTRPFDSVQWTTLDAGACALLDSCARGQSLDDAAAECLRRNPEADLTRIIATLLRHGAFAAITHPQTHGDR